MSTSTNGQYVQIPDLPIADAPNGSEWIETIQLVNGVLKSYRMPVSSLLILGKDGLSAYEVAQKNGFRGTEAEWLASLNGKSAFDIVRETHPEIDTQDKFINFITGPAGKSAYEIAKQVDPQIGTEPEWIASLYGEKGDKGDKGDTGARGPKGDLGDPGQQGPAGAQGPEGAQGFRGAQGDKGDKGDKGDRGSTGLQGLKGDTGEAGAPGSQGPLGPQGPKGDKGDKGDVGATGSAGAAGSQGLQGIQGPQGPQGLKGDKGDKGEKGDPGSGSGGGLLYWTENGKAEEAPLFGHRLIDPEDIYSGWEPMERGTIVELYPNTEFNPHDGLPIERLSINLRPLLGGHISFTDRFKSSSYDINLSNKSCFYEDVLTGEGPRTHLENKSSGKFGRAVFLGGAANEIAITEELFNYGDFTEEYYDTLAEKEANYGSMVIGGYRNKITTNKSLIVNSQRSSITYEYLYEAGVHAQTPIDRSVIINSSDVHATGGRVFVTNSKLTNGDILQIPAERFPRHNHLVMVDNDVESKFAGCERVSLTNTSYCKVFETSDISLLATEGTNIFASHGVAAINVRRGMANLQNARNESYNYTGRLDDYGGTTMIGGRARAMTPAEGPQVVIGGNDVIQSRIVHGANQINGIDDDGWKTTLEIFYGGNLAVQHYFNSQYGGSFRGMNSTPGIYHTKVHIVAVKAYTEETVAALTKFSKFFSLEFTSIQDTTDFSIINSSVKLTDLMTGTVHSGYTGVPNPQWPIGLVINPTTSGEEVIGEYPDDIMKIPQLATAQIVLSKLNLVEDNELDAVWKVNYRADIVEANGYQRDRGVIPEY